MASSRPEEGEGHTSVVHLKVGDAIVSARLFPPAEDGKSVLDGRCSRQRDGLSNPARHRQFDVERHLGTGLGRQFNDLGPRVPDLATDSGEPHRDGGAEGGVGVGEKKPFVDLPVAFADSVERVLGSDALRFRR